MLPEPRLRMLLKLPFATATFTSPAWAVLPYPTWVKLEPPECGADSSSRGFPGPGAARRLELEVLHRHSQWTWCLLRSDLPPGPGSPGRPAFPAARGSGTARHPCGAGPRTWCTLFDVHTVRSSPYSIDPGPVKAGESRLSSTGARERARLVVMTAHATGDGPDPAPQSSRRRRRGAGARHSTRCSG